jgi:hypothetical protein
VVEAWVVVEARVVVEAWVVAVAWVVVVARQLALAPVDVTAAGLVVLLQQVAGPSVLEEWALFGALEYTSAALPSLRVGQVVGRPLTAELAQAEAQLPAQAEAQLPAQAEAQLPAQAGAQIAAQAEAQIAAYIGPQTPAVVGATRMALSLAFASTVVLPLERVPPVLASVGGPHVHRRNGGQLVQ